MNGELFHMQHPYRSRIKWFIFYGIMSAVATMIFLLVTERIHTYTAPAGAFELSVPYSTYLAGETVTFTLKNNYTSTVYVSNDCPSEPLVVYRLSKAKWVRIHDTASVKDCATKARQIKLEPHTKTSGNFAAWKHLFAEPGKYRVVAFIEYFNSVAYQEFQVVARPKGQQTIASQSSPSNTTAPSLSQNSTITASPSSTGTTSPASTPTPSTSRQSRTVNISGGSVKVEYSSTTVYTISVNPSPGCYYEGGGSGQQVEITFKCGESETQIQFSVQNGKLVQQIE